MLVRCGPGLQSYTLDLRLPPLLRDFLSQCSVFGLINGLGKCFGQAFLAVGHSLNFVDHWHQQWIVDVRQVFELR
jgi:hypothetical protein